MILGNPAAVREPLADQSRQMIFRCGLRVRPVSRPNPDLSDPMDRRLQRWQSRTHCPSSVSRSAYLEQLEAEHLRLEDWAVFGEFAGLELADPVPAITRNAPPSARSVIRGSAIGSTKSSGRSPRARSSACRSRRIRHRRAKKETITSLAMLETTSWTGDKTQTLSTAVSVETPA
jgi:hypothetical protein